MTSRRPSAPWWVKYSPKRKKRAGITKAAARERLKVDDTTLWRWDKCGYLKAIHIGRSVYYREADIKRLEEGRL